MRLGRRPWSPGESAVKRTTATVSMPPAIPASAIASRATLAIIAIGDRLCATLPSRAVRWVNCAAPTRMGVRGSIRLLMRGI